MVTHKEALRAAMKPHWFPDEEFIGDSLIEELNYETTEVIRAYLDARGLVMVPKRITYPMGLEINLTGTFKPEALQVRYAAMLAAAPDPFRDAP